MKCITTLIINKESLMGLEDIKDMAKKVLANKSLTVFLCIVVVALILG